MRTSLDRRVLSDETLDLVRSFQRRVPCHLAGGAALAGAHLSHRLSNDIDLFCHRAEDVRELVRVLPDVAREQSARIDVVRDAGTYVRAAASLAGARLEIDLVHESQPDLSPPEKLDQVTLESFDDLRAAKVTCILSRTEPRDLVDLFFLDRAGFPPENDLALALRKDAGIDPAVLGWLLGTFPVRPLPAMLEPLTEDELRAFRDDLRERMKRLALGAGGRP